MASNGFSLSAVGLLLAVATTPRGPASARVEGTIQLVGRMRVARAAATATAIVGDRVLIAGGMTEGGGALREFEVFDASANRVVAAGEMDEARAGHSATRLSDGRVLILGGYNGRYLKSATIFDPRTARFAAAGAMTVGRSGHTATLLGDGTVLIAGGVGDGWSFLSSAELYDPQTGRFTPVASMSVARESHTATSLGDGRVLIAGGHRDRRENIVVYGSSEIYDPATKHFSTGPALTTARHKHEAVALADGRVLVVGGSDPRDRTHFASAEVYDPVVHRWIAISPMHTGRYKLRDTAVRLRVGEEYAFASAVLLNDGQALVLGGYDNASRNSDGIWRFRE